MKILCHIFPIWFWGRCANDLGQPYALVHHFGTQICAHKADYYLIQTFVVIDSGNDYHRLQEYGWGSWVLFWYIMPLFYSIGSELRFYEGSMFLLYGKYWIHIPLLLQWCKIICQFGNKCLAHMDLWYIVSRFLLYFYL